MLKGLKNVYNAAVQHGEDIWYGINFPFWSPEEKAIHLLTFYIFSGAAIAGVAARSPTMVAAGACMMHVTSSALAEMGRRIRSGPEEPKP